MVALHRRGSLSKCWERGVQVEAESIRLGGFFAFLWHALYGESAPPLGRGKSATGGRAAPPGQPVKVVGKRCPSRAGKSSLGRLFHFPLACALRRERATFGERQISHRLLEATPGRVRRKKAKWADRAGSALPVNRELGPLFGRTRPSGLGR